MKKLLVASFQNCSEMRKGEWEETDFLLFQNGDLKIKLFCGFSVLVGEISVRISENDFNKIRKIMEVIIKNPPDEKIEAYDGTAWEFEFYNTQGNVVYKREIGYTYGINNFERLQDILNSYAPPCDALEKYGKIESTNTFQEVGSMEVSEKRVWGIHSTDDMLFLNKNVIAIGWSSMGDLSKLASDREAFKTRMAETYPDAKKQAIATNAGQIYRFVHEIQIGDYVVFPSKINRMINIGTVESEYYYNPQLDDTMEHFVNRRKVKWLKHIPRTSFSQGALYEVGAAMSLFTVKNYYCL